MSSFQDEIFAPRIKPKYRHLQIFKAFDELKSSERLKLINGHGFYSSSISILDG